MLLSTFSYIRRGLATRKNSISQVFFREDIQKLLTEITRYEESKIFAPRPLSQSGNPKLIFMTDDQLEKAKTEAYENVKARMQMPPVLEPDLSPPEVFSRDEEIVGSFNRRTLFIDISLGFSNRSRMMSVRETDGTLRAPTHEERSRLNNMFYPSQASIDVPKLFDKENLTRLLDQKEYKYILDRACVQFEPDDPRYIGITSQVYERVNQKRDFDKLRSTRHFGPMALWLTYNKMIDNLVREMLSKKLREDVDKLLKIYEVCHNEPPDMDMRELEKAMN